MPKIHFFCAGGTIDKVYFDAKSDYQIGQPAVQKMLKELPVFFDYEITSVLKKDSLDMTQDDRNALYHAIKACCDDLIVITHGTDTMPETAKTLTEISDKTIVLTGAMAPAIFKDTDALFNVGCAIAAVQTLKSGVFIVMNGEIFNALDVRKDREKGGFTTLNG